MYKEVIGVCPVCGKQLLATKLSCAHCHTEISGEFALSRFSYLSKEELQFVETFIKVQGNIKEMEKEFGISYPTVKKTLEGIITKMGYTPKKEELNRQDILEQIRRGEISVDDAVNLMKK